MNGDEQHAVDAERAGGSLEAMVEAAAYRLSQAGEALAPGDRIITGVLCPPHTAQPGDRVRLELEAVGRGGAGVLRVARRSLRSMTTAQALPEALSDPARSFVAGPHRLLIGDERLEAADGRTFETLDPATGRVIATVPYAGAEDVDRAVRAAREAFDDGRWTGIAAAARTRAMLAFADAIDEHADELAEIESLDNGKPVKLARRVDVALAAEHLRYFAGWPTRITGELLPVAQRDMHCYTRKEPVGVCAQIIPWNFPLLMSAWKLGPALAAGCTVVLKPAEQTPLSALRLGELALDAGLPRGRAERDRGDGETGAALVDHEHVDKIAFTGSTVVGREIGSKAGRALKRVTLELGGKSPNIILPDAEPRGGHPRRLPGHLLQHRPGLQRRLAPVRARRPVRPGRWPAWSRPPARRGSARGSTPAPSSAR